MRKVIANEFMSLDGVAQAPGGADEDRSGGFEHGGWHMQYTEDETFMKWGGRRRGRTNPEGGRRSGRARDREHRAGADADRA
jgi:hypothetical protein